MNELPEEVIRRELGQTEKILWAGRPRQGLMLRPGDASKILFSLFGLSFLVFWESLAINRDAPLVFKMLGIPLILVCLYAAIGRFLLDARQRARTTYGVTSERVIIVSGVRSLNVKSFRLDKIVDVELNERDGGGGAVAFGSLAQQVGDWFELAEGAREVYEIILEAQRAAKGHAQIST